MRDEIFKAICFVIELKISSIYYLWSRFAPIIGQFKISDIATMSFLLHQVYGKIVKVGGLIGRPDLVFVYDADEIEKV